MVQVVPSFDVELNPKQGEFIAALLDDFTRHIGFGGQKKGGKSWILRFALLMRAVMFPGTKHLLLRRSYREIMANHYDEFKRLCFKFGIECRFHSQENYFWFPEYTLYGQPSKIYLGYAESMEDADRYQGNEWLTIAWEECCQIIWKLITRINGEAMQNPYYPDALLKILYTCNPIGISKNDFKREIVQPATRMKNTVWIESNWQDNFHFARTQPDYGEFLRETHKDEPWLIEALLHGNWDVDPYKFYNFDSTPGGRHVRNVVVPHWADFVAGVDYGYQPSAFAVVWAARWQDEKGKQHLHVFGDLKAWRMDEDEQAQLALETEEGIKFPPPPYSVRYADPATKKKEPKESDEATRTTAIAWAQNGFWTVPATRKHKYTGLKLIRRLLRGEDPILTISPRCRSLIKELDDAVYERHVDGSIGTRTDPNQPDDAQDCLRHICVMTLYDQYAEGISEDWWTSSETAGLNETDRDLTLCA